MKMHPSVRALNKKQRPPKGMRHPAYEIMGRPGHYAVGYLDDSGWMMPTRTFETEAQALRFILDLVYYGDRRKQRNASVA